LFPLLASFEASALFESERILKKGAGFLAYHDEQKYGHRSVGLDDLTFGALFRLKKGASPKWNLERA
jgi:hypothetical protein